LDLAKQKEFKNIQKTIKSNFDGFSFKGFFNKNIFVSIFSVSQKLKLN
jgi:hypothetical protein